MKKSYIIVSLCITYIFLLYCLLYLDYRFVDSNLKNYERVEVSLNSGENNKENTELSQSLYNDFKDSNIDIIFRQDIIEGNNLVSNIITNNQENIPNKLKVSSKVNILEFSNIKKVKGQELTIYVSELKPKLGDKYNYSIIQGRSGNVLINDWFGITGIFLFLILILGVTIITLLYEEREMNMLRALMLDGNSLTHIYKKLFFQSHILLSLIALITMLFTMLSLELVYTKILFYYFVVLVLIVSISFVTLKLLYCNYTVRSSKLKYINYMFQVVHIILIVLVVGYISDVIGLYTNIKPNQDYLQITDKLEGYESFPQSTTGGATLDYDTKAPLYTDYYNFLNENYDTILSLLITLPENTSNEINAENNVVLVNQSYFDIFNIYKDDGELMTSDDFDEDIVYQLSSNGADFDWNMMVSSDPVTIEDVKIESDQQVWFIDGSMSLYAAHPITNGTILVIPDKVNENFIKEYSVYNWINAVMSSQTLLVKGASDSELNIQYLKNNGLDTTFRKWTKVSDQYDSLMKGLYEKISLYIKFIFIGLMLLLVLSLVDVYIYLQLNNKKIAIQIIDGNNNVYMLKPYMYSLIIKLVIVAYIASRIFHLYLTQIIISEIIIIILMTLILMISIRYISSNNIKILNKER